ncbi:MULTISPECIES: hypothetical protein [Halosimplex]|uniref:hypothetical protein n=1 Tax=Halosimplex TaxID=171163 RepID=UPI00107FAD07|nr:hypothetical protein [Halosimplex halophilum]
MATDALRRTVRRGVAVLAIPLCLIALQLREVIDALPRGDYVPGAVTVIVPSGLLVGAVGYLVLSVLAAGVSWAGDDPRPADRPDAE